MSWRIDFAAGFLIGAIAALVAVAVVSRRYVVARRPTDGEIAEFIGNGRVAHHLRADARRLRKEER